MFKQAILAAGLVLLACTTGGPTIKGGAAAAQTAPAEKAPVYTYVSEWTVPRAMWADYKKEDEADVDAMKKGVADGTLISFGTFAVLNHHEGEPTHGSWFSATSMANLMKFLEGLRNAPGATAPVLAASKHWDYILTSTEHNGHAGTFTNGYLRVARWPAKAGASDPEGKILKSTMVPILEKPKLAFTPAINVQKDITLPDNPQMLNFGVKNSANVQLASNGSGGGGGMGSGYGGGLGSGNGNGYGPGTGGNTGGGVYHIGGGVSAPIPIFTPEAEFSDEARRAKYQGVCLISLIVDAQGNPQNPRVVRPLGMGLDEKALEAVRKYKFKPAMKGGTPVPVMMSIEVNFRLY